MPLDKTRRRELEHLPDIEIIKLILEKGEKELLEIIYDRYSAKVYYKCLAITANEEIARDLAHDIMIKIFVNLSKFRGTADFSLWVHSITYNHCMDYLRKSKKIPYEHFDTQHYEQVSTAETELEDKILMDLQLSQLEALLEDLKPDDKLILLMHYQDNMPIKQIAETLSIGESAVKMRLKRSRERLANLVRKAMNNEADRR